MRCNFRHAPASLSQWLGDAPAFETTGPDGSGLVLFFVNELEALQEGLRELQTRIARDGMIWVCWYKKASGKSTELTEDIIRETALALDLVDVKVCAVDASWSGLKLVIRKERR